MSVILRRLVQFAYSRRTTVLIDQRLSDCFRVIKSGASKIKSRGPTEAAEISDWDKLRFLTVVSFKSGSVKNNIQHEA